MTRETVDGRPVYLRWTGDSWCVKWGRTVIAQYRNWEDALREILELFRVTA